MLKRPARILITVGLGVLAVLLFGQAASSLYTEILWFAEVGYTSVFWTRVWSNAAVRLVTGGIGATLVLLNLWIVVRQLGPVHLRRRYGNLEIAEQVPRTYVHAGMVIAAVLAGWWLSAITFGGEAPLSVLAWLNRGEWGIRDPAFGRDLSFYVFSLPVYARLLDYLLIVAVWSVLLVMIGYVLVGAVRLRDNRLEVDENPRLHFALLIAFLILLLGLRYWLGRYGILLDGKGVNGGVGYTDVYARLPARRVLAVLSLAAAAALVYGAFRRVWWPPLVAVGLLLIASVALGYVYPSIIQKLRVEPTQLQREREFIAWNLEYTRIAYGLNDLKRSSFIPRRERVGGWSEVSSALQRLPLWDPEPLQDVFDQVQSHTAYYHFPSVHYDRYGAPGAEEQVAIAVREFKQDGLPNPTWQTLHMNPRQVRGVGAVVTPTAEKTVDGNPVMWVHSNPVRKEPTAPAALDLAEPTVYFGEGTNDYVVLGTSGDSATAMGWRSAESGVPLNSFIKVLAFSWRFNDRKLLFAGGLTDSSRIIFRRRVGERVARIAPFLDWDVDAHPVIARGRVVWMIDGYTTSNTFPIAKPHTVGPAQVRYRRNVVKATVDGVTGAVAFYGLTNDDPILESYRRVFPGMIQPLQAMPAELVGHLRYPASFLQLQADILKQYHVNAPDVFFTSENQWELPDDDGRAETGSFYRPTYMIGRIPGASEPEFFVMVPFIAQARQNMTALLFVRNDPENYGEIVLVEFPRDRQVTGPRQVQSLLEQDPDISMQLALLRQKGSDVGFGRLRIVPLDSSLLYVQPIYLVASGANRIPQLQRVIASDGSAVNMAVTLPSAVDGLYRGTPDTVVLSPEPIEGHATPRAWPEEALLLLDEAERAARAGDWSSYGAHLRELRELLNRLARERSQ
jgi:uncharacterized membrane protein (UPF0182 family)